MREKAVVDSKIEKVTEKVVESEMDAEMVELETDINDEVVIGPKNGRITNC